MRLTASGAEHHMAHFWEIAIVVDRLYTDIAVADHRDVIMKFKKNISIFHIFYYISS